MIDITKRTLQEISYSSSSRALINTSTEFEMAHQQDTTTNNGTTDTHEKDFFSDDNPGPTKNAQDDALERVRTAGSISIPPELFEKLYLSPENKVRGDLRKTFGNPTPLYVKFPMETFRSSIFPTWKLTS